MRLSFLPKDKTFFQHLEKLALTAEKTVNKFHEMLVTWDPTSSDVQSIKNLEHECDAIVHEIMVKLNKTFVTPIDREDIHSLCKKIDDLVDNIYALSERMKIFKIQSVKKELIEMAEILQQAMNIAVSAIQKIEKLKNTQLIFNQCLEIHALENQGDRLYGKALAALFEANNNPIDIIKWKDIYNFMEKAIDESEDIADIVWGIAVKYG